MISALSMLIQLMGPILRLISKEALIDALDDQGSG